MWDGTVNRYTEFHCSIKKSVYRNSFDNRFHEKDLVQDTKLRIMVYEIEVNHELQFTMAKHKTWLIIMRKTTFIRIYLAQITCLLFI